MSAANIDPEDQPQPATSSNGAPIGVLLMAYGSPDRLEDIGPYLLDIRGGRPTPDHLVEEIQDRYRQIGGRSPLLDLTRQQGQALESLLNQRFAGQGLRFRSYLGMRHWEPRIREAVEAMAADGIQQVVALVMAPHSSQMSTGAYFARLDEAIQATGAQLQVVKIDGWYDHPGLIEAIAEKAEAARLLFPDQDPYVVFSAHSLPVRILDQGDPYDDQLRQTADLLARRLDLKEGRWRFSYQSAGQSQEAWLGPPIETTVVALADQGEKEILVVPVGFVCDHVEVLYDLDIAARQLARTHGAHLERSQSLNSSPAFIAALADLVAAHLQPQIHL